MERPGPRSEVLPGAIEAAGEDAGARISACVARALAPAEDSRWWNSWRYRLMIGALVSCAEGLESTADASGLDRSAEHRNASRALGSR